MRWCELGGRELHLFESGFAYTRAGATDKRRVMFPARLSRIDQLKLNARAAWRDLRRGNFAKLRFHLCGLWRAVKRARA